MNVIDWLKNLQPARKYPIALLGFVRGPLRREQCGGKELFGIALNNYLLMNPEIYLSPIPMSSPPYVITHLQKKSKFGFLIMWPFCFHIWWTFIYQGQLNDGTWIPGSEKVFYLRFGLWRWDAGPCKYMGPGTMYAGLHWD